jgi:hypothetical protein
MATTRQRLGLDRVLASDAIATRPSFERSARRGLLYRPVHAREMLIRCAPGFKSRRNTSAFSARHAAVAAVWSRRRDWTMWSAAASQTP